MDLKVVVASFLLLLFCSEVCSYHLQKREVQEKVALDQLQEAAQSYWDSFTGTAQSWIDNIKSLEWKDKAWELFEKSKKSFSTYTNIVGDQAYHWWQSW
ncbi:apolipoprotein C-II-like [Tiliqua scincoides]|uniref:apolipoprotein C-II-like n=1 Tax=Tiliqua scincoides TaxID=71010 RepID=UPI003462B950